MIMEPAAWYIEGCLRVTEAEQKRFDEWTARLPKREDSTPYHSGAHSVRSLRAALAITQLPSPVVIEVGFCLGHSAEIFFGLGCRHVTSVEISDRQQTVQAKKAISERWKDMHRLVHPSNISQITLMSYTFGFIDGDHSMEAIQNDYALMRSLGIKWILFDDFWPHWGETQKVFIAEGITPVAILGTMALCHFP